MISLDDFILKGKYSVSCINESELLRRLAYHNSKLIMIINIISQKESTKSASPILVFQDVSIIEPDIDNSIATGECDSNNRCSFSRINLVPKKETKLSGTILNLRSNIG